MGAVNVFAPNLDPADSYGIKANHVIRGFENCGISVNTFSLSGDAPYRQIFQPALGGIVMGYPTLYNNAYPAISQLGNKIAITTFECEILPEGWVENLNQCAAVIVGADEVARWFRNNGVTPPIYTVPLGVDNEFLEYTERPYRAPFTFLAFMDRGLRKGYQYAIDAFMTAFGNDEDVMLILKARENPFNASINNPNIRIFDGSLSRHELVELYNMAHVMVFPGREGFGIPPREFAGTGGLSLALPWGGTKDCLDEWGLPIQIGGYQPAWENDQISQYLEMSKLGTWPEPDIQALANQMRNIKNNWDAYREKRRRAHEFVTSCYRWANFHEQVVAIARKHGVVAE